MRSSADVVGWVELFENENSEITIFILKNKENTIRLPLQLPHPQALGIRVQAGLHWASTLTMLSPRY